MHHLFINLEAQEGKSLSLDSILWSSGSISGLNLRVWAASETPLLTVHLRPSQAQELFQSLADFGTLVNLQKGEKK